MKNTHPMVAKIFSLFPLNPNTAHQQSGSLLRKCLCLAGVIQSLLILDAKAQNFEPFWLTDLPLSEGYFSNYTGVIPGTSIPITISASNGWIWKANGGYTSDGQPGIGIGWFDSGSYTENITVTLGVPVNHVQLKLDDFDATGFSGGPRYEWVTNLDNTLGEPDSIVTYGAPWDTQMQYSPGNNGMLHFPISFPNDGPAGITYATWENANTTTISFTYNKDHPHIWGLFNMRIGEPVLIPEPSTTLIGSLGLLPLLRRRRR